MPSSPSAKIQSAWARLGGSPAGRWLFSRMLGRMVPYTGTIHAVALELRPGFARFELADRRGVRNHLNSIHAIALANLGEVTAGLAVLMALPATVRGIVTDLNIEYVKKARGRLVAESTCQIPAVTEQTDFVVHAEIRDAANDVVARVRVGWRLGPV